MKSAVFCFRMLLISLILLNFTIASASSIFVRPDGSDTNCNGTNNAAASSSPNCAFSSIQAGVNVAKGGDTVIVSAGTYGGFTTANSGAAGSPITFTSNGTDAVTITGQIVVNHNYININGFTATYNDWYEGGATIRVGYTSPVNHISVTKCHFIGNDPNTYLTVFYADDVLFDGNLMEGPKFYIGMVLGGQRHTISNNIFRNVVNVERIFNVAASNSVWRGNEIYGLSWTGDQSVHPDIWQTINDGSIAQNNIIENNYIHDTGDTQVGNIETNPAGTNVSNWTFRNNLFANSGTLYSSGGYFKFYNNTYYRTGASNQATVLLYNGTGYGDSSGTEFKNNIYIQDPTQGTFYVSMGNPTYTHDYNMVANTDFTPRSDFSEPHGVNGGNPQFTSVFSNCTINVCDFHIGFSSAAKDRGTTISGYSTDYAGNSRVAPWDIGAYEFGSGSALTPTALSAPVHLRIVTP